MQRLFKKKFIRYCIPFFTFVFGGSLFLREFTQLRYTYSTTREYIENKDKATQGMKVKKPGEVTIETEYEKLKNLDLDKWENVRIPRPWDEEKEAKS